MVAVLILAAAATATPTATPAVTPTSTPRPTVATTTAPIPGAHSETYGKKVPLQLRQQSGSVIEPEATPTEPPNSLAGVAARIKLKKDGSGPVRYVDVRPSKRATWLDPTWKAGPDDPEYISTVHLQTEGDDGVLVYFVVSAADIHITRGTGHLVLTIAQAWPELFRLERDLTPDDFGSIDVGVGAFKHQTIAFSTGRIPFSQFRDWPSEGEAVAKVTFTRPDGKELTGSGTARLEPRPRGRL